MATAGHHKPPQATALSPTAPYFHFSLFSTVTLFPTLTQLFKFFIFILYIYIFFVFDNFNLLEQIVVVLCCWVACLLQGVGKLLEVIVYHLD
jgi:hypothetical protein